MVPWGSLSPDSAASQEDGLHKSVCVCVTVCLYVRVRAQSGHTHNNPSTTPSFSETNDSPSQLCPGRTPGSAPLSVPYLKEDKRREQSWHPQNLETDQEKTPARSVSPV